MRCLLNFCSDWKSFLVISTVHNFCVDLKFSVPSNIDVSSTPLYFQELFWRNGDTDAKIFPHIRCRLPSLHLYLAPLLTFPWGCSTVVRDYWQPSSCSPALPLFSLSLSSFFSLSLSLSTLSCRPNKDVESAAYPRKYCSGSLHRTQS